MSENKVITPQEELDALKARLSAACNRCSPSALPDARHRALVETEAADWQWDWWNTYPHGQLTALAYRVFRIVNEFDPSGWTHTWEEQGKELPE